MRKLTAISLTLVLLLTGCTVAPVTPDTIPDAPIISDPNPVAPEPTPEKAARTYESVSVQLYEKDSYVYIFQVNAEMTEVDGCRYYIEPTVSEVQREEFISAQTALNKKLSAPEGLSFYVLRNYTFRSESENNLAFYEIGGTATWRQALVTVQLLEGDAVNYGWAYARADALARELGWETDSFEAPEDMDAMFIKDPGRLNLIFPCFTAPYSTEEEVAAAKYAALLLYKNASDETLGSFLRSIESYAETLGLSFSPTGLQFYYGGLSLPMVVVTKYTENRIGRDYTGVDDSQLYVIRNIGFMLQVLNVNDSDIQRAREKMHYSEDSLVVIRYDNMLGGFTYHGSKINIVVGCFTAIAHEYVHYIHYKLLPSDVMHYTWLDEALAEYLSCEAEYQGYLSIVYTMDETERAEYHIDSLDEHMARTDLKSVIQEVAESGISPIDQLTAYGKYYAAKAYMGFYLASEYGEDTFIKVALDPSNIESYIGISRDELFDNWLEFILAPAA